MASRIAGITVEIGGDTTKLSKALESVNKMFAIQACGIDEEGANRLPKHSTDDRYEIKSKGLVRLIYQSCGWDRTRSYRLPGVEYPQHRLVNYDLSRAIPIFEGRIDKKTQEAQRGEKALKA